MKPISASRQPWRWLPPRASVVLFACLLLPGPATATDEAEPAASPGVQASPSAEALEIDGAWGRMARAPFGAIATPGGWTGTELVVVDPEQKRRAAAYYPSIDTWRTIARPPRKVQAGSPAYWTGAELVFVEPRGAGRHGLVAYDPAADAWRTTATAPLNVIAASTWADDRVIVVAGPGGAAAAYDPATDAWAELPALPATADEADPAASTPVSLHWTAEQVFALVAVPAQSVAVPAQSEGVPAEGEAVPTEADPVPADEVSGLKSAATLAFVPLDLEAGAWGEPSVGPLDGSSSGPLWTGEAFVFLARPSAGGVVDVLLRDGRYDPATDTWTTTENDCRLDTGDALWTGELILGLHERRAYDPARDECDALAPPPWARRSGALRVWTGSEALEFSGRTAKDEAPRRDGLAFDPWAKAGSLWAVVDKPSRPVRIRIPALGIDLPVISDERRVQGSTPGYPACDVALYWSYFDLPGAPGTTWILAHAQRGMFLPLLEAVQARGSRSLTGQRVEVQLRDGRLLTYRTYKVKPRASTFDLRIATQGRRRGEQRLVLQTSTGVGSAPKLQVAARLVDVSTTDEPRPEPRPRACG